MFRLLDRLVYRELLGPWVFGVIMFSVLLMAGTYLFRLTDLVVKGIPVTDVAMLSFLYMPGLVAKTFPMAILLASLLAFARLSNDSEIIAAQAGGASMFRIALPVAVFGLGVSFLTFAFSDYIVPNTSARAFALQTEIGKTLTRTSTHPYSQPLLAEGRLVGQLSARDINLATGTMHNATVVWYGESDTPTDYFYFDELYYTPAVGWRIRGGRVIKDSGDTVYILDIQDARPPFGAEALDFTPGDIFARTTGDYDALSMAQIRTQIEKEAASPVLDQEGLRRLRDLQVGYWTKITVPLSGLVFALVGAPVSIRRVRQSVGMGVGISIMLIFAYYLLHNYLTILAKGGLLHPAISAFTPVALGLVAAIVLLIKKSH